MDGTFVPSFRVPAVVTNIASNAFLGTNFGEIVLDKRFVELGGEDDTIIEDGAFNGTINNPTLFIKGIEERQNPFYTISDEISKIFEFDVEVNDIYYGQTFKEGDMVPSPSFIVKKNVRTGFEDNQPIYTLQDTTDNFESFVNPVSFKEDTDTVRVVITDEGV